MEQPETDSESGLLERLGNALMPEAPADEAVEASQEDEVVENEQPEAEEEAAPQAESDGLVDLELEDGQTYKVPPALKDGYLRHSDYTRKTQELATLHRTAQAGLQQQALLQQFQEQTREDSQQLVQVEAELKRLRDFDWSSTDTETLLKTRVYMDQLRDRATELKDGLGRKRSELEQGYKKAREQAAESAYEYISRHAKEWTRGSSTEREVASYATAFGLPPEVLGEIAVLYPGVAVLAHKAQQFDKLQATKGNAVQKAQKAPPVVKPGAVTNTSTVQQQNYTKARQAFKKDPGNLDALARVLMQRGNN